MTVDPNILKMSDVKFENDRDTHPRPKPVPRHALGYAGHVKTKAGQKDPPITVFSIKLSSRG